MVDVGVVDVGATCTLVVLLVIEVVRVGACTVFVSVCVTVLAGCVTVFVSVDVVALVDVVGSVAVPPTRATAFETA